MCDFNILYRYRERRLLNCVRNRNGIESTLFLCYIGICKISDTNLPTYLIKHSDNNDKFLQRLVLNLL